MGDPARFAVAICDRHTGIGADGWIRMSESPQADAAIELWNSDGSRSEISGNGTRCAAALVVAEGGAKQTVGQNIVITTGAGPKKLRLLHSKGHLFSFEMNMGRAVIEELVSALVPTGHECVVLNVGNPQCAVFATDLDFDWRTLGAHLERHPRFPNRTNVSFVRVLDEHRIAVRFFERGAGETMSSGTGSTGAVAAALARGWVKSPVQVETPAGPLEIREDSGQLFLTGPAEIVARGEFYYESE